MLLVPLGSSSLELSDVGIGDGAASAFQIFDDASFLSQTLGVVVLTSDAHSSGDSFLLSGGQRLPGVLGDAGQDGVNNVVGDSEVLSNFVECSVPAGGQGVVLAFNSAGLQSGVQLGECQRSGLSTQSAAQVLPSFGAGHAEQQAVHVSVGVNNLAAGVDDTGAQVSNIQRDDVGLGSDAVEDFLTSLTGQSGGHVFIAVPEVSSTDHFAPCQVGLGGQGLEGDPCEVSAAIGLAHVDGVPFVLGGEQGGVSVNGAGDGAAGQLLNLFCEDGHGLAVPVSAGRVCGEDQVDSGIVCSSGDIFCGSVSSRSVSSGSICGRSVSSRLAGAATGDQAENHDHCENQSDQFFHFGSS